MKPNPILPTLQVMEETAERANCLAKHIEPHPATPPLAHSPTISLPPSI